jgi:hypothetical protein
LNKDRINGAEGLEINVMAVEILVLAVIAFGFCVLVGRGKIGSFYKVVICLLFAPFFLADFYNQVLCFLDGLPIWVWILSILLIPFFVSAALRILFPKAVWLQKLQTILFEGLIYAATFPFRFLFRAARFVFQKERRRAKLNPHRAAVGNKPPIINHSERQHNRISDK